MEKPPGLTLKGQGHSRSNLKAYVSGAELDLMITLGENHKWGAKLHHQI